MGTHGITHLPDFSLERKRHIMNNTEFSADDIAVIVRHALVALLWSEGEEYDESGEDVIGMWDETYDESDATPELRLAIACDLSGLVMVDDDETACRYRDAAHAYVEKLSLEQFGHDMTLTRNGHGAGFWDRGAGEIGAVLTEWAHGLGTLNIFHGSESTKPEEWAGMFHAE